MNEKIESMMEHLIGLLHMQLRYNPSDKYYLDLYNAVIGWYNETHDVQGAFTQDK